MFAAFALPGGREQVAANEAGEWWGYSKTYQNNWTDECQWYDTQHDFGGPYGCYKGVWSDTDSYSPTGQVSVYEYAQKQAWGYCCYPYTAIAVFYQYFDPYPAAYSATNYVTTGGVHYYPGDLNGEWDVNVIGYAYHYYGPSGGSNPYVYTESVWGGEYTEP